jgi:hypothetical protein
MGRPVKIAIGLLAVLLMGWIFHGPAGRGAAFVDGLEAEARTAVAQAELPGIEVRMKRDPLSRVALLSGPANDLQREGLGSQPGLNDYVRAVPGIASVHWDDEKGGAGGLPLLAESELLVAIAYLIGLGLGALFFGRRKRQSFLD